MIAKLALLFLLTAAAEDAHEKINPLYRELRQTGVAVADKVHLRLPAPTLVDGLDAKAQKAVIDGVAGNDYDPQDLLRKSVTAPFRLQVRDLDPPDAQSRAFGVDVWFVAHGDLEAITRKEFLEKLQDSGDKDRKFHVLTEAERAKRKLGAASEGKVEERYTHSAFTLLNDVRLSTTLHTEMSRRPESILFASQIDPRFAGDADFPNSWQAVTKDDDGKVVLGPPHPYAGSGSYLRITRLNKEVAGREDGLLVEAHLVFVEPRAWFRGTNLLRSKIPTLVQDQVRSFRRELDRRK